MSKVLWEQQAILVEVGCETIDAGTFEDLPNVIRQVPASYYMIFRLADGQTLKIERAKQEELPELNLCDVRWFRMVQDGSG